MKIIIAGAYAIGTHLARLLSRGNEEITLIDENILKEVGEKFSRIITIEDGVRMGGMGSAVLEWMNDHDYQPKMTRMGLPDEFVEHGTVAQLREIVHLDKEAIKEAIKK